MELEQTPIQGLYSINRPIRRDERGFFSRLFGADEISAAGRPTQAIHINSSTSKDTGTLRGIHFQYPPYSEAKIVSCVSGSIWDLGVDLRPGSPTRFKSFGMQLTPENGKSLLVPEGFGHAFITLEPNSTVVYVVSSAYSPENESGLRFDDPSLDINLPIEPKVLSEKDQTWELLDNKLEEINNKFFN